MTGLAKPAMSIHPMASPTVCLVSIEVSSLTVTSDCSCLVIIIIIILLLFLFFPDTRLESQISKTETHSATKLHSYMDPYPTHCSARFGVDPDYRSGSRARSVFSDFPQYLRNQLSDLQLQYL